tara:strand:+ start:460 stop:750 length:291 start_codon:yes stop_codon:yes gene_type:complete
MCVAEGFALRAAGIDPMDPFGANAKNKRAEEREARGIQWAREDTVRDANFAQQEKLANIEFGNPNRSSLNAGTGTPSSTRGGGRSSPGGSKSNRAY